MNECEDYEVDIVALDKILDHNQEVIYPIFTSRRNEHFDVYYMSKSIFKMSKRAMRNKKKHNNFLK